MEKLKIEDKDLDFIGIDAGGGPIAYYKGEPFTGINVDYFLNGNPELEIEYKNGSQEGFYRAYFENGQLNVQYEILNNAMVIGTYKEFDETGIQIAGYNDEGKPVSQL